MKKLSNKKLSSFFPIIIFVTYSIIVFIIWKDDKDSAFWFGWFFSLLATCVTVAMPYIMVKDGKEIESIINGFSIYYVTIIYFIAQLVVGLICMISSEDHMAFLIILEVLLQAAFLFIALSSYMGSNFISEIEKNQKEKVYFVKSAYVDLNLAGKKVQDENLKRKIEKVAEIAKNSDPMSNSKLAGIETSISTSIIDLNDAISDEKSIDEIEKIVDIIQEKFEERNEKCKLLK